jgi:hypothetical protein
MSCFQLVQTECHRPKSTVTKKGVVISYKGWGGVEPAKTTLGFLVGAKDTERLTCEIPGSS